MSIKILAVIPVRAGSRGIPRKNVRIIAGKPLVSYIIETAKESKYITDIVMTSNDVQAKEIAKRYKIEIIDRPDDLCEDYITLDMVVYHAVSAIQNKKNRTFQVIITLQVTSPLLTADILDDAIKKHIKEKRFDTTISGVNAPNLAWGEKDGIYYPLYKERLNRQYLPKYLKETGAFVITNAEFVTKTSRFGKNVTIYQMPEEQTIDIDTAQDWIVAEALLKKKKIIVRVEGYREIGLGHIYRMLTIAYSLIGNDIKFVLSKKSDLGIQKIEESRFPYQVIESENDFIRVVEEQNPDIIIHDILDTSEEYMKKFLKYKIRLINFEDMGSGSKYANAVINALYQGIDNKKYYWGENYYCMREEFLYACKKAFSKEVKNILVIFGGTDPCNLTEKTLEAITLLEDSIKCTYRFIIGLGYCNTEKIEQKAYSIKKDIEILKDKVHISSYMEKADLAISSQGRTMYELASMHIPAIVMAQNKREEEHIFGSLEHGFINLGLGEKISAYDLAATISWIVKTAQIREQLYNRMKKIDLSKGTKRVKDIILGENI